MDQHWIVVDLDERACLHGGGKLGEWFWNTPGTVLDALRVPDTSARIDTLLAGRYATQRSPLFRLPPELFDEIYIHVRESSGAYDARLLLLALTCKSLLACARRHIVRLQTRKHAPLAGHRLICVSDGAKAVGDYPQGMLSLSETETLLKSQSPPPTSRSMSATRTSSTHAHEPHGPDTPLSLYEHATARWRQYFFKPPSSGVPHGCVGMAGLADLLYRPSSVSRMSAEDFALFRALTAPPPPYGRTDVRDEAGPWAVCNLSKREYVHVRAEGDQVSGSESEPATLPAETMERERAALWHLLLVQICWSPSPMLDMGYEGEVGEDLGRGRWAGDRFTIVPMEGLASDGWRDVTENAVRLAKLLKGV